MLQPRQRGEHGLHDELGQTPRLTDVHMSHVGRSGTLLGPPFMSMSIFIPSLNIYPVWPLRVWAELCFVQSRFIVLPPTCFAYVCCMRVAVVGAWAAHTTRPIQRIWCPYDTLVTRELQRKFACSRRVIRNCLRIFSSDFSRNLKLIPRCMHTAR